MSQERPEIRPYSVGKLVGKPVGKPVGKECERNANGEAFYRWVEGLQDSSEDDRERSEIQLEMEL